MDILHRSCSITQVKPVCGEEFGQNVDGLAVSQEYCGYAHWLDDVKYLWCIFFNSEFRLGPC